MDRRRLLILSQCIQLFSAFFLALLIYTHVVKVWHIFILSFITGTAQAFGGQRQALAFRHLAELSQMRLGAGREQQAGAEMPRIGQVETARPR